MSSIDAKVMIFPDFLVSWGGKKARNRNNRPSQGAIGLLFLSLVNKFIAGMMLSGQQRNLLICRFPFAAYGRNDGALFFQCSKSLIHFLTVGTQCLGHVACGNRLASLAHSSNYAVNDQDFRYVVVHEFERHGWQVNDIYLGNPSSSTKDSPASSGSCRSSTDRTMMT